MTDITETWDYAQIQAWKRTGRAPEQAKRRPGGIGGRKRDGSTCTAHSKAKYTPKLVSAYFAENDVPEPVFEHRFHEIRKWRFDLAWPEHKLALEVEGGVWTQGRHTRSSGFIRDMDKYNTATMLGWRILRVLPGDLCMMDTILMVKKAMEGNRG